MVPLICLSFAMVLFLNAALSCIKAVYLSKGYGHIRSL